MDCLHDFDDDLRWVFAACRDQIESYPPAFRQEALKYLDRYNIFNESFAKNYICYLLPFWLGQTFPVPPEVCRKISVANLFGFFYFLVQDAVMDAPPGESRSHLLPLGNLLLLDFSNAYREIFPTDPLFWSLLQKYFTEWAESTRWEQLEHWGGNKPFSEADLLLVAGKSAPLKITCAAVCIGSGALQAIEPLAAIIDQILITSQLLDDYVDWPEDLQCGNCTFFLSQVMESCGVTDFRTLNESHVKQAVYFGKVLKNIRAIMKKNHEHIKGLKSVDVPYLTTFHEKQLQSFQTTMKRVQKQKTRMLEGGFSYWLSENPRDFQK